MKPRTGDGPLEVTKEGRGIVVFNDTLSPGPGPAEDGIRELAGIIRIDERLVPLLLPIAGGLLAAIKR